MKKELLDLIKKMRRRYGRKIDRIFNSNEWYWDTYNKEEYNVLVSIWEDLDKMEKLVLK